MDYKEKLKRKEWIDRRNEILKRDNYQCTKCKSKHKLQVHHKAYVSDREPWEYTDHYLITLCEKCHKKEHKDKSVGTYFVKSLPIYIPSNQKDCYKIITNTSQVFAFGKYKGLTFEEVQDLKYIDWYLKTIKSNQRKNKKRI